MEFTPPSTYIHQPKDKTADVSFSEDEDYDDDDDDEEEDEEYRKRKREIQSRYLVTKRIQLTEDKRKGSTFKTLECSLFHSNNSISYKEKDINPILQKCIGVSKPIIENVLFCHQEDSLWPLGESNKLKEKFDEIFSVSKFTNDLILLGESIKDNKKKRDALATDGGIYETQKKHIDEYKRKIVDEETKIRIQKEKMSKYDEQILVLNQIIQQNDSLKKELDKYRQAIITLKPRMEGDIIAKRKYESRDIESLEREASEISSSLGGSSDEILKRMSDIDAKLKRLNLEEESYRRAEQDYRRYDESSNLYREGLTAKIMEVVRNERFGSIVKITPGSVRDYNGFAMFKKSFEDAIQMQLNEQVNEFSYVSLFVSIHFVFFFKGNS